MAEINPSKIKLSQLRALVAIAEAGTFSDAALHIDLSQSAVSHAIATLEDELGVILLNRGRQGAVLTPVGSQITYEAKQVLQALDNICAQAQQERGLQSGVVRVKGFRSVATHILPAVIEQFRDRYPGVQVAIDELPHHHQVEDDLRQGRADLGFTHLPAPPEFDAWELLRDRYLVLLPPSAQPSTTPISWQDLTRYPIILGPIDDCCRQVIDEQTQAIDISLKPAYEVREDSTIISMVRQGLGATILPKLAAEPIPNDIVVVELPVVLERIIGVIVLSDALLSPAVYAFLDVLKTFKPSHQLNVG
ncbi:MAG: LysR family transcriptional regulator [Cyanobacteria bacterium J06639_16]